MTPSDPPRYGAALSPHRERRQFLAGSLAFASAAYAQIEYKITPEIELVGGARITHDEKESSFRYDVSGSPRPLGKTAAVPEGRDFHARRSGIVSAP